MDAEGTHGILLFPVEPLADNSAGAWRGIFIRAVAHGNNPYMLLQATLIKLN